MSEQDTKKDFKQEMADIYDQMESPPLEEEAPEEVDTEVSEDEVDAPEDSEVSSETLEEDGEEVEDNTQDDGEDDDSEPDDEPVAPEHWAPEKRAAFNKLPKEAKTILSERHSEMEADYTRKTQQVAEQRKQLEPLESLSQKWNVYFQSMGIDSIQGIDTIVNAERTLRTGTVAQRQQIFAQLAQDYGVDVTSLGMGSNDTNETNPEIQQLNQKLAQLEQQNVQFQQKTMQQEAANIEKTVADFESSKDSSGNPLHPHFGDVRVTMGRLIQADPSLTLETAYEKAVRLDDDIWNRIQAEKQERVQKDAESRRKEAAKKAKKSASVNVRSKSEQVSSSKPTNPKEWMAQAFDELSVEG